MKSRQAKEKRCAMCGEDKGSKLQPCGGSHVHEECLDSYRKGRDVTTKEVKGFRRQVLDQSPLMLYPTQDLPSIVEQNEDPAWTDQVALDARAHRVSLLTRLGVDSAAMGIDAALSVQSGNSLEIMLAHQLAAAHKSAMEVTGAAFFEENTVEKARLLNLAARLMDTFQRGLLTFQRLRTGGEQRVTVQHVTVSEGGQAAIVGNIQANMGEKRK